MSKHASSLRSASSVRRAAADAGDDADAADTTRNAHPRRGVLVGLRPDRPLLLWDGQCDFCARWSARAKCWAGSGLDCQSYQQRQHDLPEIPAENFERSIHLVLPEGHVLCGAAAVSRVAALRWPLRWVYWLYCASPCFARWSEALYRRVAARRKCRDCGGDSSGGSDRCGL